MSSELFPPRPLLEQQLAWQSSPPELVEAEVWDPPEPAVVEVWGQQELVPEPEKFPELS